MSDEDSNDDTETYNDEDEEGITKSWKGSKRRRRFSLGTKMKIVKSLTRLMTGEGMSQRKAAAKFNVTHKQVIEWRKQLPKTNEKRNIRAKALGDGRHSGLDDIENEKLKFILSYESKAWV